MNDYIRRAAKFIVYIVLIFILILGVFPLIKSRETPHANHARIIAEQPVHTDVRITYCLWIGLSHDLLC